MLIDINIGVTLKGEYLPPITTNPYPSEQQRIKLAVCLHPWSWLGGNMHDPVLDILTKPLLTKGYHVFRYNSRGVGGSSGWPTLTGLTEGKDLEAVVDWSVRYISDVVIVGYSYGSLIASLFPPLPNPQIKTSYILISYPLGPRSYLTLFHSPTYTSKLRDLLRSERSNVLVVYGDRDEFTSVERYERWGKELKTDSLNKKKKKEESDVRWEVSEEQGQERSRLTLCCRPGASHFWRGRHGVWLAETVGNWVV
ncbi:Alpha/Beta hydrolase protein [Lentinula boryana]|uniref:Alpha/Beta hydrolase protein n=1 Tax=Lentinula boryana TaxID=40481 RepID=A0ABQ8QDC7_9AGAR|nr:Alpha/Beta hydrolase protein [Lentinula boryana]